MHFSVCPFLKVEKRLFRLISLILIASMFLVGYYQFQGRMAERTQISIPFLLEKGRQKPTHGNVSVIYLEPDYPVADTGIITAVSVEKNKEVSS